LNSLVKRNHAKIAKLTKKLAKSPNTRFKPRSTNRINFIQGNNPAAEYGTKLTPGLHPTTNKNLGCFEPKWKLSHDLQQNCGTLQTNFLAFTEDLHPSQKADPSNDRTSKTG